MGAIESRIGIKGPFHFWCAIFYRFFHHNPPVNGTEVYGMIPAGAMLDSAAYYLQVDDFHNEQVLELKLLDLMSKQ